MWTLLIIESIFQTLCDEFIFGENWGEYIETYVGVTTNWQLPIVDNTN